MMRGLGLALLTLSSAALISCGADGPRGLAPPRTLSEGVAPTPSSMDGVETWRYPDDALELAPRFTLDPTPTLVIGGAAGDPAYDLTYLHTATLLDDGRVATLSAIGARLFLFAADGRAERSFGRQGKGPGEFMRPSGLLRAGGDSLLVVDDANLQLTWLRPDHGVVAQRPLAPIDGYRLHRAVGVLSHGLVVLSGAGVFQEGKPGRVTRPLANVGVLSPRDGTTQVVTAIPDLEMTMFETRYRGRSRLMSLPLRLGEAAQVAAWDSMIVTTGAGSLLELRNTRGQLVRRLTLPGARRPVTAAMRKVAIEADMARLRAPGRERLADPAESDRIARELPFSDSLPPVGQLLVGVDRLLWVVDPVAPGEREWAATGIAPDGTLVARVLGSHGTPMAFGRDAVLLRSEDADGVVSLTRHRLVAR